MTDSGKRCNELLGIQGCVHLMRWRFVQWAKVAKPEWSVGLAKWKRKSCMDGSSEKCACQIDASWSLL